MLKLTCKSWASLSDSAQPVALLKNLDLVSPGQSDESDPKWVYNGRCFCVPVVLGPANGLETIQDCQVYTTDIVCIEGFIYF